MYLNTYMDIFSHIFKMVIERALRQRLLFIALNCLTGAAFRAISANLGNSITVLVLCCILFDR